MDNCAPTLTSKTIPGICGRGDGRAAFTSSSVRPQSPTGRHAPVSVKGAAGAYPVVLLPEPPADRVLAVIDDCWSRGSGLGETIKSVHRHTKIRIDADQVRRRFVVLADLCVRSPP